MAEASTPPKQSVALPHQGDHDRAAMLSVRADGTFDQHNPEFITSPEFAVAATKRQFAQQATSSVDIAERGAGTDEVEVAEDPAIKALKEKHDAASKSAESAAESAVKALNPKA